MPNQVKESLHRKKSSGSILYWFLCGLLAAGIAVTLILPVKEENNSAEELLDHSTVSKICELATLRCFYHNVAEYESQPGKMFQYGLFKYGYKKMWMEYSGIVEAGVNAAKIRVSEPDENGVVDIYIPDATILNVSAENESMSDPLVETGLFTKITLDDKATAFSEAQIAMKKEAENDEALLVNAKENAKSLIKKYIRNIGNLTGNQYQVNWIEEVPLE